MDECEIFLEKECSDGLPLVTPTEERVQRMLSGTRQHAKDVIGHIPPMLEPATVRTAAIHAVAFEKRGIPATVIITQAFKNAALFQLRAQGMAGHPDVELPHPISNLTAEAMRALT